jgi:hypothetical protein
VKLYPCSLPCFGQALQQTCVLAAIGCSALPTLAVVSLSTRVLPYTGAAVVLSAGVTGGELSAAGSSSMSALDSFLDMSADQLASAGSRISRAGSSSVTGPPPGAAAAAAAAGSGAGFERYGLEHPASAAEGGDEEEAVEPGQQQAAKVRAEGISLWHAHVAHWQVHQCILRMFPYLPAALCMPSASMLNVAKMLICHLVACGAW